VNPTFLITELDACIIDIKWNISFVVLLNVTEIPFVALAISGEERLTGLVLRFLRTVAVSSRNQMT